MSEMWNHVDAGAVHVHQEMAPYRRTAPQCSNADMLVIFCRPPFRNPQALVMYLCEPALVGVIQFFVYTGELHEVKMPTPYASSVWRTAPCDCYVRGRYHSEGIWWTRCSEGSEDPELEHIRYGW